MTQVERARQEAMDEILENIKYSIACLQFRSDIHPIATDSVKKVLDELATSIQARKEGESECQTK